jgi:hypothetical protein
LAFLSQAAKRVELPRIEQRYGLKNNACF